MGKKSNGKLRAARLVERALRKGVDLSASATQGHPYVYATDGSTLPRVGATGRHIVPSWRG